MGRSKFGPARGERYSPEWNRDLQLRTKFGLNLDQYEALLASQGGGCAVCGKSPEDNGKALAVDHDHACCPGKKSCGRCNRGLLCNRCNSVLGYVDDSVETLRTLINYLNTADKLK